MVEMDFFGIQGSFLMDKAAPTAWSAGVPLYDVASGRVLLAACERYEIAVLGIEGFHLDGGNIMPDMDFIADFSALSTRSDFILTSIRAAHGFLQMAEDDPTLVFEFLLMAKKAG